ncbi:hypothetical protein F4779DRAFT_616042 [Xylariaceae sp. FL0662B]|nr:hypothetical protein F4779DRAFT_616042 [Xylariaceae sp. FL0662B]
MPQTKGINSMLAFLSLEIIIPATNPLGPTAALQSPNSHMYTMQPILYRLYLPTAGGSQASRRSSWGYTGQTEPPSLKLLRSLEARNAMTSKTLIACKLIMSAMFASHPNNFHILIPYLLCIKPAPIDPSLEELPPRAIGLALLDIYFERLYNANLLFNRSRLFESYLDCATPSFLLRAIFALASLFLRKPPPLPPRLGAFAPAAELVALATYARNGRAWAESASCEVLLLADRPSVVTVQAFSCLGLYWFSMGDMNRARIYLIIAYTSCYSFRPLDFSDYEQDAEEKILHKEREQGCFWACWASLCVSAIPDAYARNAWEEADGVPLPPAANKHHAAGSLPHLDYMDRDWNCVPRISTSSPSQDKNTPSIMAEYMKLMARIQVLSRTNQEKPDIAGIQSLSGLARRIYESSQFPPYTTGGETVPKDYARLVGLNSLYHLCQMVVLCPLVSLFSGRQVNPGDSEHTSRAHAEIVTKHALQHGQLIRDYVAGRHDISKLSPLVGFASFVATSIFLTLLRSRARRHRDEQEGPAQIYRRLLRLIQDTIDVLTILKVFWEPLEPMVKKLQDSAQHVLQIGDHAESSCAAQESRAIEVPLTGANSPAQEEDVIITMYIESPQHRAVQRSTNSEVNSHPGEADRRCQDIPQEEGERVNWEYQDISGWRQTQGVLDISEELLDFNGVADWDLDLLSVIPTQMA